MKDSPATRWSLLQRIRDPQDERAWAEFARIYEPLVYRLARRYGMQDSDARELAQEVLLTVSQAIDGWQPDPSRGSFRGWLFRIARNLIINFFVRQRRQPVAIARTDLVRLLDEQSADARRESQLFDEEYRRQTFRWAADEIRGEFRPATWQAFWKTCVEHQPIPEVARELGLSTGNVYVARSRVMARLKSKIQDLESEQ